MLKWARKIAFLGLALTITAATGGIGRPAAAQDQEVVVITGEHWLGMEADQRIAFVAGLMQLVEFERQLAQGTFDEGRESFIPHLVAGVQGHTIGGLVEKVDGYYQDSPEKADQPVLHAIFETVVFPQE